MSNIGRQFEDDLAAELGVQRVPGSGNQWHSKMDVYGRDMRWSLKATEKNGYRLDEEFFEECLRATGGLHGTGETPMWALRFPFGDFVIMRKDDFISTSGEFTVPTSTRAQERKNRSTVPQLLRED